MTTGQVARICKVAPRTVTKWFDSGQLKGYRIPGSRDRRIPRAELLRFMKAHNIPTGGVETGLLRVLIIDPDWEMARTLAAALEARQDYEVRTTQSGFEAGLVAQKFVPHVILVNLLAEDLDAACICRQVRSSEELQGARIIAVADSLSPAGVDALLAKGFDSFLPQNAELSEVINTIEDASSVIS